MRVMQVHNYYTQPGGEDTVFHAEKALLSSRGNDVLEYLESNERIASMNSAFVALETIWSRFSYKNLKQLIQEKKPDIVHFHNTFPLISPSAYYACQDSGVPVVQTLHNQRLICPASSFYRDGKLCLDCFKKNPPWPAILHACYHNSYVHSTLVASMLTIHRWMRTWQAQIDMFICSTNFYQDLFTRAGLPSEKMVVIPHFVDRHIMNSPDKGLGQYALFIGRLDPEKGVKTLLEAWCHVDIPLKIRGSGHLDEMARQFVAEHGLVNIEFLPRMGEVELSSLIQNARFLIMPSEGYYETFGMVVIEAYSRAVPVIASNIGVAPELVIDQQTGLLFEAGNALDLAAKARWMWNHSNDARAMGSSALSRYYEHYTPDQHYQSLISTYERVIRTK